MTKEFKISDIESFKDVMRVLHCPIRWDIIEVLKSGPKSSDEIFQKIIETKDHSNDNICEGQCEAGHPKDLKKHKAKLYYHLRELNSVGIIDLEEYRPSESGRAPEKVWKLNLEKVTINFMK